ncbi:MAG: endolytic transglycosylase MltG [Pseudomonadota bacterium]|nr:endolytic transglycosylase MltG [Pseudomonadota bacterium]
MIQLRNFLLPLFFFLIIIFISVFIFSYWSLGKANSFQSQIFIINPGVSFSEVAQDLSDREIIDCPLLLIGYQRVFNHNSFVKAGEYQIESNTSALNILKLFIDGEVITHQFTIIEGWSFNQLLEELRSNTVIRNTGLTENEIMISLGISANNLEGQFLAETYNFIRGDTDLDILSNAHDLLNTTLDEVWNTGQNYVLRDSYQALILASIIEKEAGVADERAIISGVFSNRLNKGMRLQSDPTVIYGVGSSFDGDITFAHLNDNNDYNTYRINGLPPTPICLVGRESLVAAVLPDINEYFYFVATGNSDGRHFFSSNLEDHNKAVEVYLSNIE